MIRNKNENTEGLDEGNVSAEDILDVRKHVNEYYQTKQNEPRGMNNLEFSKTFTRKENEKGNERGNERVEKLDRERTTKNIGNSL